MLLFFIFLVLLISVSETGCVEGSLSVDSSFFLCEIMCRFIYLFFVPVSEGMKLCNNS